MAIRGITPTVAGATVGASLAVYPSAIEVYSNVADIGQWWPPPYEWSWGVLTVAVIAASARLVIKRSNVTNYAGYGDPLFGRTRRPLSGH